MSPGQVLLPGGDSSTEPWGAGHGGHGDAGGSQALTSTGHSSPRGRLRTLINYLRWGWLIVR